MYANGYSVYKNNSVNYASKEQLLLMLVDGAVKYAKIAEEGLREKDIQKAHSSLIKVQDIFSELSASLDRKAGDWAEQLYRVYRFIYDKLVETNMKKDINILEEIMPLIINVRELWHETYKKAKGIK
ncbi:flagellar export chaperone FliS [Clostridium sp. MSJ-8]|uniref:flagellar export chaperone FliS n=1 Tax=Clostridium sp. MSJ-8 TaxID=2841510 RepID=UPI001C0F0D97|nr:flagellar export chaperone FliS [Clostridium sp. MSJ-8]MBU5488437.1 flagellar export chaperone FliS [Clostridium sp. MSJ-8]